MKKPLNPGSSELLEHTGLQICTSIYQSGCKFVLLLPACLLFKEQTKILQAVMLQHHILVSVIID